MYSRYLSPVARLFVTVTGGIALALLLGGCGASANSSAASDGTASQIAAGSVGGSSNDVNSGSSGYALEIPVHRPTLRDRIESFFTLFPEAYAFQLTCSGGTFSPNVYAAGQTFAWTPISCSLTYRNGRTASVQWSGPIDYAYAASCTGADFRLSTQPDACVVTRSTPSNGTIRTLTRVDGASHAVTINTTAPAGYNSAITTSGAGTVATAEAANFASRQIVLNGTQLVSTLTPAGGSATANWNHTVSTDPAQPIQVTGIGASKVVTAGSIIVQHNLAKYTTTSVVQTALQFTNVNCCFPTAGSLQSTFSGGPFDGKTETVTFTSDCGEAVLTDTSGATQAITLSDCL